MVWRKRIFLDGWSNLGWLRGGRRRLHSDPSTVVWRWGGCGRRDRGRYAGGWGGGTTASRRLEQTPRLAGAEEKQLCGWRHGFSFGLAMPKVPVRHPNEGVGGQLEIQAQSTKGGLEGRQEYRSQSQSQKTVFNAACQMRARRYRWEAEPGNPSSGSGPGPNTSLYGAVPHLWEGDKAPTLLRRLLLPLQHPLSRLRFYGSHGDCQASQYPFSLFQWKRTFQLHWRLHFPAAFAVRRCHVASVSCITEEPWPQGTRIFPNEN